MRAPACRRASPPCSARLSSPSPIPGCRRRSCRPFRNPRPPTDRALVRSKGGLDKPAPARTLGGRGDAEGEGWMLRRLGRALFVMLLVFAAAPPLLTRSGAVGTAQAAEAPALPPPPLSYAS